MITATRKSLARRSVITSNTNLNSVATLVVSKDGFLLGFFPWKRAVKLMLSGSARIVEPVRRELEDGTLEVCLVRSPSVTVELPLIVELTSDDVPDVAFATASASGYASRMAILRRDEHTCGYCGDFGDTIDHIFPKSRGGGNTWQNLVTACYSCNQFKGARTPEECGMLLWFDPRVEEGGIEDLQAEVWNFLSKPNSLV